MSNLGVVPVPPAAILLFGALALALLPRRLGKAIGLVAPALALLHVLALGAARDVPRLDVSWMGLSLELLAVSDARILFGIVFSLIALIGSLYALHVHDRVESVSAAAYAAGALGVTFAGDLATLIVFWELMAVSSTLLIVARRTPRARAAAVRYIAVHALGGALLLAGVIALVHDGHPLSVHALAQETGFRGWLVLLGVVINAAVPPLHAWLPDSYAEASPTGSVFLSAFTTKTAVLVLLLLFPGWRVLLYAGVVMTLYGVVYAVLENNIRRLLAYHIVSQVGYMVAAVGMGTPMALDGAGAHAFSHILYKALLFMGVGAVIYSTGKEKLSELGGLAGALKWVMVLYAIGAASIAGFPLFNGFTSKSIIVTAASQGGWPWAEFLLVVASVGTFFSTGLKLIWFTFISPLDRKHDELVPVPWNMYASMAIGAALCALFGVYPALLYRLLPFQTDYHPYTVHHVVQSVQLLLLTALVFWLLFDKLKAKDRVSLDSDWLYRKPLASLAYGLSDALVSFEANVSQRAARSARRLHAFLANPVALADRIIGRGVLIVTPGVSEPSGAGEQRMPTRRAPLGVVLFVVLTVFAIVALATLLPL
jgi:multicomponent Na+:H+ antiporter subunit D